MFGKGSVFILLSFMVAMSGYQLRLNRAMLGTVSNFSQQYVEDQVYYANQSAMNYAINKVWADTVKNDTFTVVSDMCTTFVAIQQVNLDTIRVLARSWAYTFDPETYQANQNMLKVQDSMYAYFAYKMPVSKYFWFTNIEGNVYWVTGDSVWGPVHTNGKLRTYGAPVFFQKVTAGQGIVSYSWWGQKAQFLGGYEVGVQVELPTDMSYLISAAQAANGGAPPNTKSIYNEKTTFTFFADGKVRREVDGQPPDTVKLSDIAPNGVIYSSKDVRVKGVLNGQVTIYSDKNIWIDDDIVYADNPESNPNSDDLLGLVAKENVYVTDNAANNNGVTVHAAIMAIEGSFTAEHYDSRPYAGYLTVVGSIVQNARGPIGTFTWWGLHTGFSKRYKFDNRFNLMSPPKYPYVRELRLLSWWE
ncbi:MAG: hypothetical protein D6715_09305 [Calditrichaeota bacterium]|nr:MAG: hypothetical protein D6715_09305 [Calditrichota bacterium]